MKSLPRLCGTVVLGLFSLIPIAAHAADELPPRILKRVREATVFVKVTQQGAGGRGSGFFVEKDLIVTNAHVLGITEDQSVLPDDVEVVLNSGLQNEYALKADIKAVDVSSDLAFLNVPLQPHVQPLELKKSDEVQETLSVYILGFPLGEALDLNSQNPSITIATGSVSSLRRDKHHRISEIQIDGTIIPGNSGGPIIDSQGNLVAVSVATLLGLNVGFAIPADIVQFDLQGRIDRLGTKHIQLSETEFTVRNTISIIDPTDRITNVGVYYWWSKKDTNRPLDKKGKFPTYGAPGDGPRKNVLLKRDPQSNVWQGELPSQTISDDKDLWIQPAVAEGRKVKLTGAVNHSQRNGSKNADDPRIANAPTGKAKNQPAVPRISKPESKKTPPANTALARRFRRKFKPVEVQPQLAKEVDALDAIREVADDGSAYSYTSVEAKTIELSKNKLIQMVSDPRGDKVYAVFENESKVSVFSVPDFKKIAEIAVPRNPVAIWCDAEILAIACDESRVIVIADTETQTIVRAIPLPDYPDLQPIRIAGTAPDGSLMTLWRVNPRDWQTWLFLSDRDGKTEFLFKEAIDWCSFPSGAKWLWTQYGFSHSPSASPTLYSVQDGERLSLQNAFGKQGLSLHRGCGHGFVTKSGEQFLLPIQGDGFADEQSPYAAVTLVVDSDLSEIQRVLPGSVFAEYPQEDCFVGWQQGARDGPTKDAPEILYYSRSTGRIFRRIIVHGYEPHNARFLRREANPDLVFVPGQELLLIQDRHARIGEITVIRCGPVAGEGAVSADPKIQLKSQPPQKARIGAPLAFTPSFDQPAEAKKVVFRLAEGVFGMEISADSGRISFTPTAANLGMYDIKIVADVDGVEVPVASWVLEIGFD